MNGTYYRWSETDHDSLVADLLMSDIKIEVESEKAIIAINGEAVHMSPDEARLIGVRLIEAATLAAGRSTIRSNA